MDAVRILWTIWLLLGVVHINRKCSGNRRKTEVISDVGSTVYSECVHESREKYYHRVRDPNKHISTRLVRYFTFGGILQAISEETGIPRDQIVTDGRSQLQDKSSTNGTHAAHIVRVGSVNAQLKQKNDSLHGALKNYIGHTQNVLRVVNVWHGIGGAIDRYQSSNLTVLAKIDFNGLLDDGWDNVATLQATFRKIVDEYVLKESIDPSRKEILRKVKDTVYLVEVCMLFENGTAGYNMVKSGEFVQRYNRKRSRSNS